MNFIANSNIFAYNLISFHFFKTNKNNLIPKCHSGYVITKNIFVSKLFNNKNPLQTERIPNSVFLLSVFSLYATSPD